MKTLLLLFLLLSQTVLATHLLGGYIQVKQTSPAAQQFTINIILFVDGTDSQLSSLAVCFGDGSTGMAQRVEQTIVNSDLKVSRAVFSVNHIYAGVGTYTAVCLVPNRTGGLRNIPTSINTPLGLATTFSTQVVNNTPMLSGANLFRAVTFQKTTFAFSAVDAEGDSLTYFLAKPQTAATSTGYATQLSPISSYSFPNDVSQRGTFKIGTRSGELVWNAPAEMGRFSFAITVQERRNGILLSQTQYEQIVFVVDQPGGTPGVVPPYEPAQLVGEGVITGVSDPESTNNLSLMVSPVPASDQIRAILLLPQPGQATLQLVDMTGRIVREAHQERPGQRYERTIDVRALTPGLYLLRAQVNGQTVTRQVLKR